MTIEDGVLSSRSAVWKEICRCNNTQGDIRLREIRAERMLRDGRESSGKYFKPKRGKKKRKRKNHGNTGAEKK